ncbi:MAG TPA: class I SAM-dependent methyltransferase [Thermoleophilaceae bacterium]|jgi:SAM-dependent methyltransferase|nr:class I SAM-dependent methyltransferase [Thermoleophilaceae bacterium]
MSTAGAGSEPYDPDNLLDRISRPGALEAHYRYTERREADVLRALLSLQSGDVLSVGCGWHPGRHLFPAPAFRITGVEPEPAVVERLLADGALDEGVAGRAGELPFGPASFDVVLYRLVLHHIAYRGELSPCFLEAGRLLRPGGALVAIEPGLWHPVGAALALANRFHLGPLVHGTPDDVPLSPRRLLAEARAAGLEPELRSVTYSWRRLPVRAQAAVRRLDRFGSRAGLRLLGHTLILVARRR